MISQQQRLSASERAYLHTSLPLRRSRLSASRRHAARRRAACAAAAQRDEVLRTMSESGEVSVLAVTGTSLVRDACRRHATAPTASAALGRALLGGLLMCSFKGEGDGLQVTFKGDGPLGGIQIIATSKGQVKGRVGNADADPPLNSRGKLDVGTAVGKGVLAVVRSSGVEDSQPYTGFTEIQSGEVAEDLAAYLADSEQTNSALALGVSVDRGAEIRAAGGYLLQVLPFASEATLSQLEANVAANPSVTDMLHEGLDATAMTQRLLHGLGTSSSTFSLEPAYGPCEAGPLKERMARAVALLGPAEVDDIVRQEGKIEVRCEFCNEAYELDPEEVRSLAGGSRELETAPVVNL